MFANMYGYQSCAFRDGTRYDDRRVTSCLQALYCSTWITVKIISDNAAYFKLAKDVEKCDQK